MARCGGARVSLGANGGLKTGAVNDRCHGWTGVVPGHRYHVMAHPKVYAIYWDDHFGKNDKAVNQMNQFFEEILHGSYMRQLRQYGVGEGTFGGYTVVGHGSAERPQLGSEHPAYLENQLRTLVKDPQTKWKKERKSTDRPTRDERNPLNNPLFIIFTPKGTSLGEGLCGVHQSGRYDGAAGDHDLFWALIQEWHYSLSSGNVLDPDEFVDACTWCVSHEMVEAFTNPDGHGFHLGDCEIGDICECAKGGQIIKAKVGRWWVETYWDNENQSCYPLHVVPRATIPVGGYEGAEGPKLGANGGTRGANGGADGSEGGRDA
jgi:hypothetical protein